MDLLEQNKIDFAAFWDIFQETVNTLRISYCKMNEEILFDILDRCKNLKELTVGGVGLPDADKIIFKVIERVTVLKFPTSCQLNNLKKIEIPKDLKPKIQELSLDFVESSNDDNYLFQKSNTYEILKILGSQLRLLSLFILNDSPDLLHGLVKLDMKNLETLKVSMCDQVSNDTFEKFTKHFKNLKHFDISGTLLENDHAKFISENMTQLRVLKFRDCDILLNEGVNHVAKLKYLEVSFVKKNLIIKYFYLFFFFQTFEINNCQNISNKAISEGIAKNPNPTLKNLILCGNFCNDTLIATVTNLPNLECLTIATILYISERLLPLIFERLINLKQLFISSLNRESDRSMFEPHEVENNLPEPELPKNVDITNLKKLQSFSISGYDDYEGMSLEKLAEFREMRNVEYTSYQKVDLI